MGVGGGAEAAGAHGTPRQQQDQAGTQIDRIPEDGVQHLVEDAVAHRRAPAHRVERAEVRRHPLMGVRDLHRLHRAEDLGQKPRHVAGGLAAGLAVGLDTVASQVDHADDDHQR